MSGAIMAAKARSALEAGRASASASPTTAAGTSATAARVDEEHRVRAYPVEDAPNAGRAYE